MWSILKSALMAWLAHRGPRLGAALAYYAVFSLGPLLLIVSAIAGALFGAQAAKGALAAQYRGLLGDTGARAVEAMIEGAASTASSQTAAGVGVVLLLVTALGVVVQLKDALNTIWEVTDERQGGAWSYVRTYLVSTAGVLALGFLLAVSLVISTVLAAFASALGEAAAGSLIWQVIEAIISLAVMTGLFALVFKYFPDTEVEWRDVWPGALSTAVLFQAGKLAIAWYVGTQALESTYGAASSLVVLLIWVYYAAQIVLYGAEITHITAERRLTGSSRTAASGASAT